MPLKLTIKVGNDEITADGDFAIDDNVVNLTKEWVQALPPQDAQAAERQAQARIDALRDQAKGQNDALEATTGRFGTSG